MKGNSGKQPGNGGEGKENREISLNFPVLSDSKDSPGSGEWPRLLLELREIEDLWKEEIEEFSPSINLQSPFPWGWIPGKNSPSQLLLVVPNGMWGIPAWQGRDKSQLKDGDRPAGMVPHCWSSQGESCCSPSTSQGGFIRIIHLLRGFGTVSAFLFHPMFAPNSGFHQSWGQSQEGTKLLLGSGMGEQGPTPQIQSMIKGNRVL